MDISSFESSMYAMVKNSVKLPWARANPKQIYRGEEEELTESVEWRRCERGVWSRQVDAAANGEAEAEFEDDGGARVRGRREEEEEMNV